MLAFDSRLYKRYSVPAMPPMVRRQFNFMLDAELADGLKQLKARDGIPEAEQIRRSLRAWLESKGVTASPMVKSTRRPRKKSA